MGEPARAQFPAHSPRRDIGWRPISTAPKDGEWIIIYDPAFDTEMPVSIGGYMQSDERDPLGRFKKGEWVLFEWDGLPSSANPTHWMPLPAPPDPNQIAIEFPNG